MSIRMKEWGMMGAPAGAVHIPVQGLMGWDAAARGMGEGVAAIMRGSADWLERHERVLQTGELSALTGRLDSIGKETRRDLAGRKVDDWDYAWRTASGPRVAEAVAELPLGARRAGMALAEAYNNRASMEAFRDYSVQSLENARGQWQKQLDSAVEQGDEVLACRWLDRGQDVFISADRREAAEKEVRSRARLSRWKSGVQADAYAALERWQSAQAEELPGGEAERRQLSTLMQQTRRTARQALVEQVSEGINAGQEVPEEVWSRACRAGLITESQRASAVARRDAGSMPDYCRWLRRVDEVEDDADTRLALQMDIATSCLPSARRSELLKRLATGAEVCRGDRLALSRHLWNLYNRGAFGCPGDALAGRRMADLQRQGLQVLAGEGVKAAADWVDTQHRCDERWVCFSDSKAKA